jgi:hypothetical protein
MAWITSLGTWPLVSPNATSTDVVGKIFELRLNYHFGPAKISMYLKRYLPSWSSTVSRRAFRSGLVPKA